MYAVFETEKWCSHELKVLIGVCSTKSLAMGVINKQCEHYDVPLTNDDKLDLNETSQTYKYNGSDGSQFIIQEVERNMLIIN
jgi:hypothetical protein